MNKKMEKIRKLLGNKYHLAEYYPSGEWHLFRKYDDPSIYFSNDNKEIMSSQKNTIEELYEYAKNHHEIDEHQVILKLSIILAWIGCLIIIINAFTLKNNVIRGLGIGISLTIIIYDSIAHDVWLKNNSVHIKECVERLRQPIETPKIKPKEKNNELR